MRQASKKTDLNSATQPNELATLLADYRRKCGLSLSELVVRIPFETEENLMKYEAGILAPPLDTLLALSNELNIPPGDILSISLKGHGLKR